MLNNRCIRLSYDLEPSTPLYPGTPPVHIKRSRDISKGDTCNTTLLTFSSHAGTHIDVPRHFTNQGRSISDYNITDFIFNRPHVIDCPKGRGEIIEARDLDTLYHLPVPDLLLIRTGFQYYRSSDVEAYCNMNPCLSPEAARCLRTDFPEIKGIGIDCISISSRTNRELGRETHKILLADNEYAGTPVLIVEDMHLPAELAKLDKIIVSPLFMKGLDAAPCTVIGIFEDKNTGNEQNCIR